jgi:hypothetical protein
MRHLQRQFLSVKSLQGFGEFNEIRYCYSLNLAS